MTEDRPEQRLLAELVGLPQGDALARVVRLAGERAFAGRSRDLATAAQDLLAEASLGAGAVVTSAGDPVVAIERGTTSRGERALLSALFARGLAAAPPSGVDAEDRAAAELLWLAGHTPLDAFPALDAALGSKASGLWGALCDLVRRIDAGREPGFDRADALVGAAALRSADEPDVRAAVARLSDEVEDAALRSALRGGDGAAAPLPPIVGELMPAPRGPVATVLLAMTGLLLVLRGGRLLARLALARKQPAELEITREGIRIRSRTEMLGKVVREAEQVLPAGTLVRATREVRFPRLTMYAGLLALAVGSYVGVSLFVDGARAASPSMLGQGFLIVALGIALELGITAIAPGARGRCRIVLVPQRGAAVCVGDLEVEAAERTLSRLQSR